MTTCRNRDDGETGGSKDDDGTDKFKTNCQPAVRVDGREVCSEVSVDAPFILHGKALALLVSADSADTTQRLLEVSIHRTAADTVQTLEFA
jgi:hypothetical protein